LSTVFLKLQTFFGDLDETKNLKALQDTEALCAIGEAHASCEIAIGKEYTERKTTQREFCRSHLS